MWLNDDENFTFAKCKHLHLMCNRKVLSWMFICKRIFVHRFSFIYINWAHIHYTYTHKHIIQVWKQFCDDLYVFFLPNWHHLSKTERRSQSNHLAKLLKFCEFAVSFFLFLFSSLNVCVYLTWIERRKSLMLNDYNHIQFTLKLYVIMKSVIVITRYSYRIGFKNGGKKSHHEKWKRNACKLHI